MNVQDQVPVDYWDADPVKQKKRTFTESKLLFNYIVTKLACNAK